MSEKPPIIEESLKRIVELLDSITDDISVIRRYFSEKGKMEFS